MDSRILRRISRSCVAAAFFCSRRSTPARMPRPNSSAASVVSLVSGFRSCAAKSCQPSTALSHDHDTCTCEQTECCVISEI